MSTEKYKKHISSKYKRYVGSLPNGKRFQANTESELRKMISDYESEQVEEKDSGYVKPQYDPDTGERIN